MGKTRVLVAALSLSAIGLVGIAQFEGYEPVAKPPVAGDKCTVGFGETVGVKCGEKTTPVRALVRLQESANRYERGVQQCVKVPLHQYEFDAAVQLTFNIGAGAFCRSTVVKRFNAGDYQGACDAFLMWNKFNGRVVRGLVNRREKERVLCLGL